MAKKNKNDIKILDKIKPSDFSISETVDIFDEKVVDEKVIASKAVASVNDQINIFDEISDKELKKLNNKCEDTLQNQSQEAPEFYEVPPKSKDEKKLKKKKKNEILTPQVDEEKEKINEAEETVKKQSSKKKKWLSLVFMLLNIGIVAGVLVFQLMGENKPTSFQELLSSGINWWIFIATLGIFLFIMLTEAFRVWLLTYKTTKKNRPGVSYKTAAIGRYYDCITPMATGGQPFQIYYLNKRGVPAGKAISIPMGKYCFFQIAYTILTFIVMIFSISVSKGDASVGTSLVSAGSWVGFSLNFALMLLIIIFSISKKLGNLIVTGILKLLKKMHLIKNYDKIYNKVTKVVDDFQTTMKDYTKDKGVFILMLLVSGLSLVLNYSIPFLIYSTFHGFFDFSMFGDIFVRCVMIELAASFMPLPGGSGVAELSFTALFASLLGANLFWGLILWRIFTYYGYVLRGLIIIIYDCLIGNKKHEWEKKKWKLETESRNFEEEHLKDFEKMLNKEHKGSRKQKKEKKQ